MKWPQFTRSRPSEPGGGGAQRFSLLEKVVAVVLLVGGLIQAGQAIEGVARSQFVDDVISVVQDVGRHL